MGDCEKFPFYKTEPVPEELVEKVNLKEWPYCEVDSMVLAAADRIEACLKCGNYTLAHEGACNGCRWSGRKVSGQAWNCARCGRGG